MVKREKTNLPDDAEQSQRFITLAKEREAAQSPQTFERAFKVISPPKKTIQNAAALKKRKR